MKCPYCEQEHTNGYENPAYANCESYGDSTFYFQCPICKEVYAVKYRRIVQISEPFKTVNGVDALTWGGA